MTIPAQYMCIRSMEQYLLLEGDGGRGGITYLRWSTCKSPLTYQDQIVLQSLGLFVRTSSLHCLLMCYCHLVSAYNKLYSFWESHFSVMVHSRSHWAQWKKYWSQRDHVVFQVLDGKQLESVWFLTLPIPWSIEITLTPLVGFFDVNQQHLGR
jgi:hypothetical protein